MILPLYRYEPKAKRLGNVTKTMQPFSPAQSKNGGEDDGTQLQYSCLENPMDRGAW